MFLQLLLKVVVLGLFFFFWCRVGASLNLLKRKTENYVNHKNIDPSNPGLTHQVLVVSSNNNHFRGNLCFYMSHCFLALQAVSIKLG